MASQLSNGTDERNSGVTLTELPKSNVFTSNLPADSRYPTPIDSHKAPREDLGPRLVKGALYTYVRPQQFEEPELVGVSPDAMQDIGLKQGEEETQMFKAAVAGKQIVTWDESKQEGIYPWAQCYGGFQFGSWASQLGDGRAMSLFETTNPSTKRRYELQLKGAGRTPYSRFADGKAVVRSSIREYIVSEALNALGIPTTRALALTILPHEKVRRERIEPGAIVCRFAESWLRIGTFDLLRSRGERALTRQLATYVAENVYSGWSSLPARIHSDEIKEDTPGITQATGGNIASNTLEGPDEHAENRFARLYRAIVRQNALTVAKWQAYGFTNGVLNTDNTSLLGLSIDFGPFAFLDNFDSNYTPNHDDHALRYSYRNQPSIIWWNLVRLGEDLGELIGAGDRVDDNEFIEKGVTAANAPLLVKRAEKIIDRAGDEYRGVFMTEYKRLMALRLGLKRLKPEDFEELLSELLDALEAFELDFHHAFRRLSSVSTAEIDTEEQRRDKAALFFHAEGISQTAIGTEDSARDRLGAWLGKWRLRVREDWEFDGLDAEEATTREHERQTAMRAVNPKFVPRSWVLDELIDRVEKKGERKVLARAMNMALRPFDEEWTGVEDDQVEGGGGREEQERWCGDVPRYKRAMQCSCSS